MLSVKNLIFSFRIFSEEEIQQIKNTKMYDVIVYVSRNVIHPDDLQADLFHLPYSN